MLELMSPAKTIIHFIRHGHVENPKNLRYGRLPGFHLSAEGRSQIEQTAQLMARYPIDTIYTSPLERTQQTATLIGLAFGHVPIQLDDRILEVKIAPEFEGQPRNRLFTFPTLTTRDAETASDVIDRFNHFVEEKCLEHAGKQIIAVSHGDPIGLFYHMKLYQQMDPSATLYPAYGSISSFIFEGLELSMVWYRTVTDNGAIRK